jgi:DNA-directed RNA polymerase specialized sigma24 family protein
MPSPEAAHHDDVLYAAVYDELKRLARGHLHSGDDRDTLNTTELVHEAFLKLSGRERGWDSPAHFFGAA